MAYVENCIEQPVDFKNHTQSVDIIDWRKRLENARARYPDHSDEEFAIEAKVTGAIEGEIQAAIETKIGKGAISEGTPLWAYLREEIMKDIQAGILPRVPK
ncbi:hypothetical protein HY090_00085 [Candidatus Kaiserbacteria bacterium]|nr:hypothetical protein [Candidatus Kaiserbacteria bacterium]